MIALGSMVSGRDGLDVARVLNALALSLIVALTGLLVWRISRSWLWSAAASMATLFSPSLILVSSMVWSDAWGTVLVLGCVLLLTEYLRAPRLLLLLAAALVGSAAIMDRYVAIALIPVGLAAVLMSGPRPRWALHGVSWTAVALLPVAAWSARDLLQSGGLSGGSLRWHPPPMTTLTSAIQTMVGYLSPAPWLSVSVAAALVVLAAVWLVPRGRHPWRGLHPGTVLVGIGVAAFVTVPVATTFFVDASLALDYRMLAPVYVLSVVLCASHLGRWSAGWRPRFRIATWAPLLTLGGISMVACLQAIPALSASFEYTSPSAAQSPLLAAMNRLPANALVVTNSPDFVWLRDGRITVAEPRLVMAISGQSNADYATDMAQVQAAVTRQGRGWLVLWNGDARWYLPNTGQLHAALHLVPYQTTSDGEIFEILPSTPNCCPLEPVSP
jgi:hypothetical protein